MRKSTNCCKAQNAAETLDAGRLQTALPREPLSRRRFVKVYASAAAMFGIPGPLLAKDKPKTKYIDPILKSFESWQLSSKKLTEVRLRLPSLHRTPGPQIGFEKKYLYSKKSEQEVASEAELWFGQQADRTMVRIQIKMPDFVLANEIYSDEDTVQQRIYVDVGANRFGPYASITGSRATRAGFTVGELGTTEATKLLNALSQSNTARINIWLANTKVATLSFDARNAEKAISAAHNEIAYRLAAKAKGHRAKPTYSGGGGKIICTAMNVQYGFGSFRNKVWLHYSSENLSPYHERGYHRWAGPIVRYAYGGESWSRRWVRAGAEHVARERSADIWAEMRGSRRRVLGRTYRAILEPFSWLLGRF